MRLASLQEGASLALDQLRNNKFRSGLTILGIVVGVATVMAMSALIQGVRSAILSDIMAAGPTNFYLARYDDTDVQLVSEGPSRSALNPPITVAEARAVARLPAVRNTIIGLNTGGEFVYGRQRLGGVQIAGRDAGWTDFTRADIVAGRNIVPADVRSANAVVLITTDMAESLFGLLDPIDRTVRVAGQPFQVIGVFQLTNNIFAELEGNMAITPYTTVIKHLNASGRNVGVFVVTAPTATQTEAMDQVITLLRGSRGLKPRDENNFALIRQEQIIATFNRFTGVFFAVMLGLSSVALMVGGVGVIAIMMISVTERTREIGIRKAVGATRSEILWQFLFESVTVTVIGSTIGMAVGAGLAWIVAALTPVPASVPLATIIAALTMAAIAGVLFGIWPAWRAARMDPVVALRYE
jgi:putative ABC transport system permease protein